MSPIRKVFVLDFGDVASLRSSSVLGTSATGKERRKGVSKEQSERKARMGVRRERGRETSPDDTQDLRPYKSWIESSRERLIEMIPIVVDELLVGDQLSFSVVVSSRVVNRFEDRRRRFVVVEFAEFRSRVDFARWTCGSGSDGSTVREVVVGFDEGT